MPSNSHEESERFLKKYQKEFRQERKAKQALDRSKFKKTDQSKHGKKHIQEETEEGAKEGLVVRIVSRGFIVACEGKEYLSSIKGSLKELHHEDKNLVTIGDRVRFIPIENDISIISSIIPRTSALVRQDKLVKTKRQIIAANVDQVLICGSVVDPPLKPTLIDRYIIAALKGNIRPIVVINKCDLLEEDSPQSLLFEELKKAYREAHIPVVEVSAKEGNLERLKEVMRDKVSVFSGQSGVGKTSLINALLGTEMQVGDTTRWKKGSHTTTHPIILSLPGGGYCIDTPGVKSFSIWEKTSEPLDTYFEEIYRCKDLCRFRDCTHRHEEGCEVIKRVEEGSISPLRYESYLSLLNDEDTKRR